MTDQPIPAKREFSRAPPQCWTALTQIRIKRPMDHRQVTDRYFVSPQIAPEDVAELAHEGFVAIICNRPDGEVPPSHQSAAIAEAAQKAGLEFTALPLTHQTMTPENVAKHKALIAAADGPVLAYCASGTRSTVVWALGNAGEMSADDILAAASRAGYDLEGLRAALNG